MVEPKKKHSPQSIQNQQAGPADQTHETMTLQPGPMGSVNVRKLKSFIEQVRLSKLPSRHPYQL